MVVDCADEKASYCENSLMQYGKNDKSWGPSTSRSRVSVWKGRGGASLRMTEINIFA